ncbi:MAG TPA: hypothetical protein VFX64_02655, partial [Candidatus Nitrosotalea sp.]|nr:hypothetical protein [Candidatus Nitrosotalea sp.]
MSDKKEQSDQKIEIISAIMLAVIIVAIAWCAYQATLWNGIQTFKLRDENTASLKFVLNTLQQEQHSMADSILFTEYVNALHDKKQELSNFYYESFRPDMKVAVDAWLATNPLNDPHAPQTPFE